MDYGALTAARLRSGQWLHWGIRFFLAAALTASESAIIVFPTPPQPEHTAYIFAIVVLRYQYASELEGGMVSSPSSPMCSK